jgi:hypothetical protein
VRPTARRSSSIAGIAFVVALAGACGGVGGAGSSTTTSHPATPAHPLSSHPGAPGKTTPHRATAPTTPDRVPSVRPEACPGRWEVSTSLSSLNRDTALPGLSQTLVPAGPKYVTICRYAGLNQKVKAGILERSLVVTGTTLATFVRYVDAPTWMKVNPNTGYFCPMSTGLVDLLQFVYPSGSSEVVQVDIDGCPFVSNGYRTVWGSSIGARLNTLVGSDREP